MSSFERGPLAFPTPEQERRSDLLAARANAEKQKADCLEEFAKDVELADRMDIDVLNDYDPRMKDASYVAVREMLLARRMRIEQAMENAEELLDLIKSNLGEENKHDA